MAEEPEEVEDILKEIRDALKETPTFEITYPPEGGEKAITETLEINVYTGDAYADGVEGHLSKSLNSVGIQYAQSVVIDADKPIVVQLDDGGKRTVDVDKIYAKSHTKFQRVLIDVSGSTNIKFWASTNPNATLESSKSPRVLILKGSKFNTSVTADTDIFTTAISPTYPTSEYAAYFRIMVAMDTAGLLTVRRAYDGTTISENLNSGANLVANAKYSFVIEVQYNETINLRYSATATALKLAVLEIAGGL